MPPFCRTGADRGQTYQQHLPDTCHFPTATPALSLLRSLTKSLFGGIPRGTLLVLHPRDDDKENPKTPSRENSNCTHRFSAFRLSLQALGRWRSWGKTCTARPGAGGGTGKGAAPLSTPLRLCHASSCPARVPSTLWGQVRSTDCLSSCPHPSLALPLACTSSPGSPRFASWQEMGDVD